MERRHQADRISRSRRRELAIRGALGATRDRVVRQLLTESILLSIFGAAAGLALAVSLNGVLIAKITSQLPRVSQIHVDSTVRSTSSTA